MLRLALHDGAGMVGFVVLVALEMAVPLWAESRGRTSWHPGHIAERYGLFTLIVLGESVLASTVAVQVALDGTTAFSEVAPVVVGGILTVFFMWWMYFDMPAEQAVTRIRSAFVDRPSGAFPGVTATTWSSPAPPPSGPAWPWPSTRPPHHSKLSDTQAGFAITVPVAIYVTAVWALHFRHKVPGPMRNFAAPVAAVLILASSFTPEPVLATGLLVATLVAAAVIAGCFAPAEPESASVAAARGD